MFGLQTLDVILGLVFVYLLLSLVATALSEMVAQWLNWRAETLRQGIHGLLSRTEKSTKDLRAAQEEVAKAERDRETAIADLKEKAPGQYDSYETARRRLSAARDAQELADSTEKAGHRELERADAALADARHNGADAATIASLQTSAVNALAAFNQAAARSATASQAVRAAQAEVDHAFVTLRSVGQAAKDVDLLRETETSLDSARSVELLARLYEHPLVRGLSQVRRLPWGPKYRLPSYIPARAFSAALLDVVAPGASSSTLTMARLRAAAEKLPPQAGRPLVMFLDSARDDMDRLRASLETWYEDAMVRVSGLYKRKTQVAILIISAVVALGANADTVRIARALSANAALRQAVVAQAEALANNPGPDIMALLEQAERQRNASGTGAAAQERSSGGNTTPPTDTSATGSDTSSGSASPAPGNAPAQDTALVARLRADSLAAFRYRQVRLAIDSLQSLGLPLGWKLSCNQEPGPARADPAAADRGTADTAAADAARTSDTPRTGTPASAAGAARGTRAAKAASPCSWWKQDHETHLDRIAGLLLTILALSLGAPFWFDMLNKIINIRGAGRAPEEKPKSPEVLPRATGAKQ